MTETILNELQSKEINKISKGLKHYVTSDSLWNNNQLVTEILNLLHHEEYSIRDKAMDVLIFLIKSVNITHETLSDELLKIIGNSEFSTELWFRAIKLFDMIPNNLLPSEKIVNIFESDSSVVQGLITSLIRERKEYYPIIDNLIDFLEKKGEIITPDTKKSFIWIFWQNQSLISPKVMNILSRFTEDEDREVRRLTCEILTQVINNPNYSSRIIDVLERKVIDESWRVQIVAIRALLQSTQFLFQEDSSYWIKVVGLFWNTRAIVRKKVCETLPLWISITEEKNKIFLEMMENALNDENWEVRESAAFSLSKFLDLEEQHEEILQSIIRLIEDSHPEVRKTSCEIIVSRINAFNNKNEPIKIIIGLLNDLHPIVRKTAIKSLIILFKDINNEKFTDLILKILLKLLSDINREVRETAWNFLYEIMDQLNKSNLTLLIYGILKFHANLTEDIKLNTCFFFKKCKKSFLEENPSVMRYLISMLDDNNQKIREFCWEMCKEIFYSDLKDYLTKIWSDFPDSSSKISKEVLYASDDLDLIQNDNKLFLNLIELLESANDREIQITILNILLQKKYKCLSQEKIFSVIKQGRWDVQEACVHYIMKMIHNDNNENIDENSKIEYLRKIKILLQDPFERFQSSDPQGINERIINISSLLKSVKNNSLLLDFINDDQRLATWILLEKHVDYLQKIGHSGYTQITDEFRDIFLPDLRKFQRKLDLTELGLDVDISIINSILQIMILHQSKLRIKILNEIEHSLEKSNLFSDHFKETLILGLLNDPVLNIRTISWKIIQKLFNFDNLYLKNNLSSIVELLESQYEDTRIKASFILFNKLDIKEPANEWILNKLLGGLHDPTYFVRQQVWNFIYNEIELSYSRYNQLKLTILELLKDENINVRREAFNLFKARFGAFQEVIKSYPLIYESKHAIATIWGQMQKYNVALSLFSENITVKPKKIESWLGIAMVYLSNNNPQKAKSILTQLSARMPLEISIYELLKECALDLNDLASLKLNEEKIRILKRL